MLVRTNTVVELLDETEAALAALDGLVVLDTVEGVEAYPQHATTNGAVHVEVTASRNSGKLRDDTVQWDEDTVRVHLVYQLTSADGQRAARRAALRLEDDVCFAVVGVERVAGTGWRFARQLVERGPHPRSPGWWRSVQTFKVDRYQDLLAEGDR